MKLLLPPHLSLLTVSHPWLPRWELLQQDRNKNSDLLAIAVIAGFSLTKAAPEPLEADALWQCIDSALPEGDVLDIGHPKPRGEFLAYGACNKQEETRAAEVGVSCGSLSNKLLVFGDRFWRGEATSEPLPFTRMPLDWSHAFGGASFAKNPQGKGIAKVEEGIVPLPNVESPSRQIASPADRPEPAGFGAMPPHWPQRSRLYGTPDKGWFEQLWPGVPRDHAPEYACSAPKEQRLPDGVYFAGDEPVSCRNMHPEHATLASQLPGWRCRLFLQRDNQTQEEIATQLETVWLFPEQETGVLLFRGVSHTQGEDCPDIAAIVADLEPLDAPARPMSTYTARFEQDQEASPFTPEAPPTQQESDAAGTGLGAGAMAAGVAGLAAATGLGGEAMATPSPPPVMDSDAVSQLEGLVAEMEGEMEAYLASVGITSEEAKAYLETLKQSTPEIESTGNLEDMVADMHDAAMKFLSDNGLDTSPEGLQNLLEQYPQDAVEQNLEENLTTVRAMLAKPDIPESLRSGLEDCLKGWMEFSTVMKSLSMLEEQFRSTVAEEPPPAGTQPAPQEEPLPELALKLDTEQALERIRSGKSMQGYDLSDCDFSGQDLRSANLRGAFLLGVSFTGSDLEAADLGDAFCQDCDFSKTSLDRTNFSNATLEGASFFATTGKGTRFRHANMFGAILQGVSLQETDLHQADCSNANLTDATLEACSGADLKLGGATLQGAWFPDANLQGCRMDAATNATGSSFVRANLSRAKFSGATLDKCNFDGANLNHAVFYACSCTDVSLRMAIAKHADFSKAVLQKADFFGLNLLKGSLRGADCSQANITNANLFGVDVYRARLNPDAITDCNLGRTLLQPGIFDDTRQK